MLLNLSACDNVPLSAKVEAADYIAVAEVSVAPDNTEIDVNSEETKLDEIEYKTIEPPEDGWTLEKLNEVFYMNGKQVDFPLSISDLGEDYEYIDYYNNDSPREFTGGELFYRGHKIAIIEYYGDTERIFTDDTKISALITFDSFFDKQMADNYSFVINGITLNTPKEEALKNLGDNYNVIENAIYQFFLDENENRFTITFDEKKGTISGIFIDIREEFKL